MALRLEKVLYRLIIRIERPINERVDEPLHPMHKPSQQKPFVRFNPRTRVRCDATHSKIYYIHAFTDPLSLQNRSILENPFPLTHPCARPLREKRHRFYVHFKFALEPSFSASHYYCVAAAKFRLSRQTTFFLSNHVTQPSNEVDITTQSITSPNLSFWSIQSLVSTGFFPSAITARANRLMYIGALSSVTVSENFVSEPHIILTCAVPSPNTFALIIESPRKTA